MTSTPCQGEALDRKRILRLEKHFASLDPHFFTGEKFRP
jgi:hypothetical protein